jgi:hypothetical protein
MSGLLALLLVLEAPIPLAPGTWWEYRESYTEYVGNLDSTSDTEATRFEVHGRPQRPFIEQKGGEDPTSGPVEQGADWIRLGPWTGEDALPLPLEPGKSGPAAEGGGAWRVEAEEQVTVPAGNFTALRCAFRTRASVAVLWIAPGTGVVRETQGVPGRTPEIERCSCVGVICLTAEPAVDRPIWDRDEAVDAVYICKCIQISRKKSPQTLASVALSA